MFEVWESFEKDSGQVAMLGHCYLVGEGQVKESAQIVSIELQLSARHLLSATELLSVTIPKGLTISFQTRLSYPKTSR